MGSSRLFSVVHVKVEVLGFPALGQLELLLTSLVSTLGYCRMLHFGFGAHFTCPPDDENCPCHWNCQVEGFERLVWKESTSRYPMGGLCLSLKRTGLPELTGGRPGSWVGLPALA